MAAEDKTTPEVEKKEVEKKEAGEEKAQDGEKKSKKGGKKNKGEGKGQRTRAPSGPTAYNGYRLNVKNLSDETKDADQLKALFAAHGTVTDAQIKTKDDGSSRGVGFVVFEKEEDAQKAIAEMHDKEIGGKKLDVKPAERRPADEQDAKGKGKGKDAMQQYLAMQQAYMKGQGKGKGKEMMQQYMAMQQAYYAAYSQYWQSAAASYGAKGQQAGGEQKPGQEVTLPGTYVGVLKTKLRYGSKTSYLVCDKTFAQLHCDVHIEKDDIPEGLKDGDKVKFTAATMYKPWTWDKQQETYKQLPAKGYPKAVTAVKV